VGVDYGWEKFYVAVHYAVSSNQSLQQRLASCVSQIHHLDRDSFPDDETWEQFNSLMEESTKRPARYEGEGTINSTTAQMTDEEAVKHLRKICDLFSGVARAYGRLTPYN
jgi:ATP phosphoribosyltransferase regulatory subunit HisZ